MAGQIQHTGKSPSTRLDPNLNGCRDKRSTNVTCPRFTFCPHTFTRQRGMNKPSQQWSNFSRHSILQARRAACTHSDVSIITSSPPNFCLGGDHSCSNENPGAPIEPQGRRSIPRLLWRCACLSSLTDLEINPGMSLVFFQS